MKKTAFRLLPALLVCQTLLTGQAIFAASTNAPNIVCILADDFGWGSLGCYGATQVKTPNLDRLAAQGRRFTDAYAPGSVCSPTRYGLLTGRYYWRTSVKDGKVLPFHWPLHIETNRLTVASICKQAGYKTAAFGKWHLGMTTEKIVDWAKPLKPGPLEVGFDYFFGMAANLGSGPHSFIENHEVTGHIPGESIQVAGGSREGETTSGIKDPWRPERVMETLTAKLTGWIETNRDRRFFVYFAPNAVHEPIVPNTRFSGSPCGKYGDFIQELDDSVGRVMAKLDQLKLADHTLVIFTSDNGGVVNPGNPNATAAIKAGLAINGPLRGGKHSEWEGGFREPFIARWPGKIPAGTVSAQVICLTDLAATFSGLLGVPLPKGQAEDSFDVWRAFTEPAPGPAVRDHVILQAADATYAVRSADWKWIERSGAPDFDTQRNKRKTEQAAKKKRSAVKPDELFNLKEDPAEANNVLSANQKRVDQLKKFLQQARDVGVTRPGASL